MSEPTQADWCVNEGCPRFKVRELERTLFNILHQRIDTIGSKVEDYLLQNNEQLLLKAVALTRHLS